MSGLTARTLEVGRLLTEGADNEEIARELRMAKRTVKVHPYRMFRHYGIKDGVKRVRLAVILWRQLKTN